MTWAIAEGDMPSTVAPAGTFSVPYPSGYSQADFIGANAATDHRFVLNYNEVFKASLGQISIEFGASHAVVTNSSAISWTAETPFIVQLDIEDDPLAEAEQQAATTFETTAEFVAAPVVPETKNVVRVFGELEAGDGNEYVLKRGTSSEPANGTGRKQTLSPIWWQLVKHDRLNSGNFNIKGDGDFDDNAGVTDAIRAAAEYGSLITFRPVPDKYMIGALDINLTGLTSKSLRIEAYGALFYAQPVETVAETQAMIDLDGGVADPYTRPDLIWKGGRFNAEGLPYGDPDETTPWRHSSFGARGGCISIRRWHTATFEDMILKGGTAAFDPDGLFAEPGYVAGDQGIAVLSTKYLNMNRVGGIGLPDALVYPRANADMSVPDYETSEGVANITDCWARDCYQGVYGKFSGGQVNVRNFTSLRTWRPVNLLATYVPQINDAGVQEPGTGYQPYSGSLIGLRARETYEFPVLAERAQNFIIQGVEVVDWGRRPDGVASIVNGRRLAPVVYLAGCRNGVVSGVAARVRDWNGGITSEVSLDAAFLNGVYVEDHVHTAAEDPVGGGTRPTNTIAGEAIKISDVTLWGDPVEVVSVPYVGSTNDRVDWVGQDVTSNSIRGIGSIVVVKGSASATIDISGCHAYNMHGTGQEYVFDDDTSQWIDGMLVPSPEGAGYVAGAEFALARTIAAGVVNVPPQLRVNYPTVTIDTEAAAASDDLDTISGSFDGQTIVVRRAVSGRSVVLKNGTGNLSIGADITVSASAHLVVLNRRANTWYLVSSTV